MMVRERPDGSGPQAGGIVAKVDQLMALCDQLEAALLRASDRAQKLVGAVVEGVVG